MADDTTKGEIDVLIDEFADLSGKKLTPNLKEKVAARLEKVFDDDLPIKEGLNLSDQSLDLLYGRAYRFYESGHYAEARQMFQFLVVLAPAKALYYFGMGACFHQEKKYVDALTFYLMTAHLDPKDPMPLYHAIDCCEQLKAYDAALTFIDKALPIARANAIYARVSTRLELMREGILKRI